MGFVVTELETASPYVETIFHGYTEGSGQVLRPAETNWHMVLLRHMQTTKIMVVGPLTHSGIVTFEEGAELIWIKFSLGTFMPHMSTNRLVNSEVVLPEASRRSFWLHSQVWEIPTRTTVDAFINQLVRGEILKRDHLIETMLQDDKSDVSERTVRHHFLRATGLSQSHIRQHQRALRAARLLEQGVSILDTIYETGYYDQPHLTRAMNKFVGRSPAQLIPAHPACTTYNP